jgi:PAS domain S-box-containing protein
LGSGHLQQEIAERKRTEKALKESEQQYRTLYEEAPNAYFSIAPDMSITQCNRAASKLLGYSRQELLRMKVLDLYADTSDGIPKAEPLFQRFLAGGEFELDGIAVEETDHPTPPIELKGRPLSEILDAVEHQILTTVLHECQGNKRQAAAQLKIPRKSLQRKMKRYGL